MRGLIIDAPVPWCAQTKGRVLIECPDKLAKHPFEGLDKYTLRDYLTRVICDIHKAKKAPTEPYSAKQIARVLQPIMEAADPRALGLDGLERCINKPETMTSRQVGILVQGLEQRYGADASAWVKAAVTVGRMERNSTKELMRDAFRDMMDRDILSEGELKRLSDAMLGILSARMPIGKDATQMKPAIVLKALQSGEFLASQFEGARYSDLTVSYIEKDPAK